MHESFMEKAVALAAQYSAKGDNGPFGAIVVCQDKIVGEGWNRVVETHDPTAHAEIIAIREACSHLGRHDLSDCVMYSSCEPCPMCLAAIYWAHIPTYYYACTREDARKAGFDDEFIYRELAQKPEARRVKGIPLPSSDALNVFHQWSNNPARIRY